MRKESRAETKKHNNKDAQQLEKTPLANVEFNGGVLVTHSFIINYFRRK